MRYSITISEAAETDIRNAFLWYGKQQKNLDNTFERIISKAIKSIQENPLKTQIRYKKTRVFFLSKFPYGIHFNITESNILIVAVFHTSANPAKWQERM